MYGDNTLIINIDGSALTNPGSKVGCAGIIRYPDYCNKGDKELSWSYNAGTSNSMELAALINALKWINKNQDHLKENNITRIVILSDCMDIINGCRSIHKWQGKWKKVDGGEIKNLFLWKEYFRERQKIHFLLDVNWLRGKSEEQSKKVDKLAKKAAKSYIAQKTNFTHTRFKQGRSLSGKKFTLEMFKATGQTVIIRVCGHGVVNQSKGSEYEIRFEEIDNDYCIVGRFKAYTSREIDNNYIDRGHFYRATFNDDLKHPWIKIVREIKGKKLERIKKETKDNIKKELQK